MFSLIAAAALVFQVSWTDLSDNEEGFNIYRDAQMIATVPAHTQSYDDSAVSYGTQYCYQVSSFNHNIDGVLQESMSGQACLLADQPPQFLPPVAPAIGTVTIK